MNSGSVFSLAAGRTCPPTLFRLHQMSARRCVRLLARLVANTSVMCARREYAQRHRTSENQPCRGRGGTPSGMACQATLLHLRSAVGHSVSAVERSFPGVGRTDAYSPASRTGTHGSYNLFLLLPFSHRPAVRILDLWSFRCTSCQQCQQSPCRADVNLLTDRGIARHHEA